MNAAAAGTDTRHRESFVDFRGHRLACLSVEHPAPTRPPIVWLHGLTASFRFWTAAMYPELEADRSWYSISLPLHYPSTYDGPTDVPILDEHLFAGILAAAKDKLLPAGPFHLVGYSLGGFAALNYAAKYPDRVLSIVSVGGFMTGRAKGLEGVLQFFSKGRFFRKALFHASWWVMQRHVIFLKLATIVYARRWASLLRYPQLDPTLRNIFPDVSRHNRDYQRRLFRYLLDMNVMDEITNVHHPVLVIAGEKDPVIPFDHQMDYASQLPNATVKVMPGAGHVVFAECADEFRAALLDWFSREPGA